MKKSIEKRKVFVIKLEIGIGGVVVFYFDYSTEAELEVEQEGIGLGEVNDPWRGSPSIGEPYGWKVKRPELIQEVTMYLPFIPQAEPLPSSCPVSADEGGNSIIGFDFNEIIQNLVPGVPHVQSA